MNASQRVTIMWIKVVIIIGLIAIAISLFSALRMMSRNQGNDREKMARYLTIRVSLSVLLLVLLGVAYMMGWIEPHGINQGPMQ